MSAQLLAASGTASFNPIPFMVLAPVLGAVLIALVPRARDEVARQIALGFSLVSFAMAIALVTRFDTHEAGFQFLSRTPFIKSLGISWSFGIDGISLWMVALTGLLFTVGIAAVKPDHDPKAYYGWMLVLMTGSMGTFVALDLIVFFLFFEVVLVPMYFLIGSWGHGDKVYAATKFFLYTTFGSAFLFVGILATAYLHQRGAGGHITFDVVRIARDQVIGTGAARWLFAAFAIAFAVKIPMFPVHTWLPDAHTEAPTAGSVILAGVLLKLGAYGLIRFGLYLFPEAAHFFSPLMLTLGVVGILYGAVCAAMQADLKRLVAYSSVAHMGFIVIGLFSLTRQGIDGGVLQMLNHGISTPALFLLVGLIYERRHTREIAQLGGIQKVAPVFAGVFMLVMLSSVGLPGLNGFPGEFLALAGTFAHARWWGVLAASGTILAAVYLLWAYQRVFHGPANAENRTFAELRVSEALGLLPLLVLIVALGVFPKPVLDRIEPSVNALVEHMADHVPAIDRNDVKAPVAAEGAEASQGSTSSTGGSGS
ncbi:MAG: NADH-quinone oxidoreductase subunit M [Microthrixaceae bacterium]